MNPNQNVVKLMRDYQPAVRSKVLVRSVLALRMASLAAGGTRTDVGKKQGAPWAQCGLVCPSIFSLAWSMTSSKFLASTARA